MSNQDMNHKEAQLSCILYIPVSHITYQYIWDHVSISPHIQPHIGTSPTSTVNSGDSVGGGGLSSMTPMGTDGSGVGVPLCPGLLTSSWAATIHQDRANRTRAATGVRLGYLNSYNAAVVDDVKCTCTEGFYLCLSSLPVKQFTGLQSVNLPGSKKESNMVATTDACPSAPFNQAN